MAQSVAFRQIPATERLPLFWAEVDPTLANSNLFPQRSLIVGQTIGTGSSAGSIHTSVATSAPTASGAVITFSAVPAGVQPGMYAQDLTTTTAIPAGTTVLSKTSTTVTLSGTATGVLTADSILFSNLNPQLVSSVSQAETLYGPGSMIGDMVGKYRQNDLTGELWVLPLVDDPAAVGATGTLTVAGTPTVNANIPLYVNGTLVPVAVTTTMSVTNIASAISTAVNAAVDPYTSNPLPVTTSPSSGVVTFTARHKGLSGNDIDLRIGYYGAAAGEVIPAGITLTFNNAGVSLNTGLLASGATNPSTLLTILLATLADMNFDFIAFPYSEAGSLDAIKNFMNDISGRWAWSRQIYGHVFSASRGSLGTLQTLGTGRNDQHASIMGYNDSPSPSWHWAAAFCGASAASLRADPGLPLQTVPLVGILAPPRQSRFQLSDRTTLDADGIDTFTVQQDGTVLIENGNTTYQQNSFSQPDNSYYKITTMFKLMAALRYMRSGVTTTMARKKLAADGSRVSPGSNIVTPNIIRAYLIQLYNEMINLGWVQDLPDFTAGLIVQLNQLNPNRVDVLWDGVLIAELNVFALLAQFRLQPPGATTSPQLAGA